MSRKAEGRLIKFLDTIAPANGVLPLTHITQAYLFAELIGDDQLKPQQCEVFDEELIYLFYGRPSYRAKDGNNAHMEFEWPIILIFDPDKILEIKRVYPFDTGAFELGIYKEFFHSKSERSDFELEPSIESAKRMVSAFYQDHKEYYTGYTRKNINVDIPNFQFELQGLHALARLPGQQDTSKKESPRDERSSAIEVQVNQPILFKDALYAIILPDQYMDKPLVLDALDRWEVEEIREYPVLHNMSGETWVGTIYHVVLDIYQKHHWL